jgi:16S rRNA (guanine(1405)-N(7))-methyltransferase
MPVNNNDLLDQIVVDVIKSKRYRQVDSGLIRSVAQNELLKRHNLKETVKAVKNKLHQVGGAYLEEKMPYDAWLDVIREASRADPDEFSSALRSTMEHHASTRERLSFLDEFYSTCLAGLPPVRSVLDLACGLNPLANPWMHLADGALYLALDIYQDMMDFLSAALSLFPLEAHTITCNLVNACPTRPVELALLLKTIPCLDQIDNFAGERLLDSLHAEVILVSFPLRSLGGREVGMATNYERHFLEMATDKGWKIDRFGFSNELVFRIIK